MDNKKIIIIGIFLLIIVCVIIVMLMPSVNYERLEITPNGTNLDVPSNQTKYRGDIDGVKIWSWDNGALVAYNSHENANSIKLNELAFNAMREVIKKGENQTIDGFTCYVINADELFKIHLFDIIKVNYKGKFYCIPLSNETSHDNLMICCKDKDVALHMAKSVEYKNVFPNSTKLDNAISKVGNITGDLKSKASDYANKTNFDNVKSEIENKAGDLKSKASDYINNTNLNDVKPSIEKITGNLVSISLMA